MNIIEILQAHAIHYPDAPAIIDTKWGKERVTTFAELESASAKMAVRLQQSGLCAGDTALVFAPMSAELYITLGAIFRLGMIAMFLDPAAGREYLENCCRLHQPQAFIATPKAHLLRLISPALRRIRKKIVIGNLAGTRYEQMQKISFAKEQVAHAPRTVSALATAALITFTSGSTGAPKATLRTHEFLLAQHRVLQHSLTLTAGDIDLATLPVFVLANLASGVTSLIPRADLRFPGQIKPAPIVTQIQKHQLQRTAASPALLENIADYCLQKNITLDSCKKIFTGGAPVFPRLLDKLQTIAPHATIVAVYGSTEAEPIAEIARHEMTPQEFSLMKQGNGLFAGTPVPEIELRIVRDQWGTPLSPLTQAEFAALCLPTNEVGEIVVSGAHVLPGYLHGRGDEETKFRVGENVWHRTGDAGYLDARGRLWLLGRCAAKIIDVRGVLYPFAVECAALSQPDIKRAALMQQQEKRLLVIERLNTRKNIQLREIQNLLWWANIDTVKIVGQIPVDKRHNAKVDYPALQELLKIM